MPSFGLRLNKKSGGSYSSTNAAAVVGRPSVTAAMASMPTVALAGTVHLWGGGGGLEGPWRLLQQYQHRAPSTSSDGGQSHPRCQV
jgi:hypothetical protein